MNVQRIAAIALFANEIYLIFFVFLWSENLIIIFKEASIKIKLKKKIDVEKEIIFDNSQSVLPVLNLEELQVDRTILREW